VSYPVRTRHRRTLWAAAVLALLASVLVLEGIPVIHAHKDGEPAFYNAQCSLSLLATQSGGAPLPSLDVPGSRLADLPVRLETDQAAAPSRFVWVSVPRAPPVV